MPKKKKTNLPGNNTLFGGCRQSNIAIHLHIVFQISLTNHTTHVTSSSERKHLSTKLNKGKRSSLSAVSDQTRQLTPIQADIYQNILFILTNFICMKFLSGHWFFPVFLEMSRKLLRLFLFNGIAYVSLLPPWQLCSSRSAPEGGSVA